MVVLGPDSTSRIFCSEMEMLVPMPIVGFIGTKNSMGDKLRPIFGVGGATV